MFGRTSLLRILCLAAASVMVFPNAGCESGGKALSMVDSAKSIFGNWNLDSLMGQAVPMLGGGRKPSISIGEDGSVSGMSGVNRFSSSLDLDKLMKGEFAMKPAASTKMAGAPEAMNLEDQFLQALQQVTGFNVDGDTLSLTNGAETLMKFLRTG